MRYTFNLTETVIITFLIIYAIQLSKFPNEIKRLYACPVTNDHAFWTQLSQ